MHTEVISNNGIRGAVLTDLHLDRCCVDIDMEEKLIAKLFATLKKIDYEFILILGDIDTALGVAPSLTLFEHLNKSVYYVLGNHDYYGNFVDDLQTMLAKDAGLPKRFLYLPGSNVISLSANTALIGVNAWSTLTEEFITSNKLSDTECIKDFEGLSPKEISLKLDELNSKALSCLSANIDLATQNHKNILVSVHIPAFNLDQSCEAYSSPRLAEIMTEKAKQYPNHTFYILSGHIHKFQRIKLTDNLFQISFDANYFNPTVSGVVEV